MQQLSFQYSLPHQSIKTQRVADVCAAEAKTMTDLVDTTTKVPPSNASASHPEKVLPILSYNVWLEYCSTAVLTIWKELEKLFFSAGIHPSYIICRINMAFQLLAGRLSPFLGGSPNRGTKKGDNEQLRRDEYEEGVALKVQNRTTNTKRRRAQVSEHGFHGKFVTHS